MIIKTPFHILLYSLTFGGTFFHSFILSPIAFKKLPRKEFGELQNNVFPWYFLSQAISPVVLGLTAPFKLCPFTIGTFALSSVAGAINFFYLLPVCQGIKERRDKLVADKQDVGENGEPTAEYAAISRQFGKFHGMSIMLNMMSVLSVGAYSFVLARRF